LTSPLGVGHGPSHGHGRRSRWHRHHHRHRHGDVENQGSFSDSHDDDDSRSCDSKEDFHEYQRRQLQQQLELQQQQRLSYQETSMRSTNPKQWSKYQLRFALCSILNFILIIVIIAMGVVIAKNNHDGSNNNNNHDNLNQDNSNSANNLVANTTNTDDASLPSFAPMPSCLQSSFRQLLLPRSVVCPDFENNNNDNDASSSCPEIFMAVDGNHSVVTVGNTVYFFRYTDEAVVDVDVTVDANSNSTNDENTTAVGTIFSSSASNNNNNNDGTYSWKNTQTIQLHSSNEYLPVAISQDTVVVGAPTETKDSSNGVAYIYEWIQGGAATANDGPSWTVVDQLEHGWTNTDVELDAGIVSSFGKTVDVRDGLIAIGAYADIGTVHPTFFFRRNRFGWNREEMSNQSNDRLRSVATVALGPDGLALSTIRDPPFSVTNEGTVFLFRSQNTNQENANSNNNNNNMEMGLFQKLTWDACDLFGDVAQFLEDGSLLASCWKPITAEDDDGDDGGDGDGNSDSAVTSKVSILYFTKIGGTYDFQQEFVMDNDVAVSDLDSRWFTVDRDRGALLVRERSGGVRVYGRMGGAEDPWQVYPGATLDGDGAANVDGNDDVSGGEMAVSGNTVFMQMDGDLQVFQLNEC